MAKQKVTYTLDPNTVAWADQAALRAGLSTSAWIDRVTRNEAIRLSLNRTPQPHTAQDALLDELERAQAEADHDAAR